MDKLILGTRGSKLALVQTKMVMHKIKEIYPKINLDYKIIKTKGDKIIDVSLNKINDKGFFVKEIQDALLSNNIDVAVHSLKDLPVSLEESKIAAVLKRENPQDVLLSINKKLLSDFKSEDRIGTTSLRRKTQIRNLNSDVKIIDIRGNVDTRINKMKDGFCEGLVLAYAGVKRLGLTKYIVQEFKVNELIPAPAQGAIALEISKENINLQNFLRALNHDDTMNSVLAERSFLRKLNGGCHLPFACNAKITNDIIKVSGMISSLDSLDIICKSVTGKKNEAENLGVELAQNIIESGGLSIISKINSNLENVKL